MLSKLTGAYNKQPNGKIGKLFKILADSMEDVEGVLQDVNLWRDTENAQGNTLDRIGANFGIARNGASDILYGLMIKIKLTSMLSGGDVNTIISAASTLFDIDPSYISVEESYPAEVRVVINDDDITPEQILNADITIPTILRVVAAGVQKGVYLREVKEITTPLYHGTICFNHIMLSIPADPI
jgi:hypothetical protein